MERYQPFHFLHFCCKQHKGQAHLIRLVPFTCLSINTLYKLSPLHSLFNHALVTALGFDYTVIRDYRISPEHAHTLLKQFFKSCSHLNTIMSSVTVTSSSSYSTVRSMDSFLYLQWFLVVHIVGLPQDFHRVSDYIFSPYDKYKAGIHRLHSWLEHGTYVLHLCLVHCYLRCIETKNELSLK